LPPRLFPGGERSAVNLITRNGIEFRGAFFVAHPGDGWRRRMTSRSLIGGALWLGFVMLMAAIIGGAFH